MKRLLWIFPFLLLTGIAQATDYYWDPTGGSGSTCSQASPCALWATVAAKPTASSGQTDKIVVVNGTHTVAGAAMSIGAGTFSGLGVGGKIQIVAQTTGSVIISGLAEFITCDANTQKIEWNGLIFKNGTGSHAIYITDSSNKELKACLVKNGAAWSAQYANVVELSSLDGVTGSDDNLLEEVWVIGSMRYGILIGGTAGFSERNVLRRCVVRFDGGGSPEPHAGISNYGATTGVDGARDNLVLNCITIDFNDADGPAEGVYAGFYDPHSAVRIYYYGCMAVKTKERGWLLTEDAGATGMKMGNCWAHYPNNGSGTGIACNHATGNTNIWQVTVSSTNKGLEDFNGSNIISTFSLFMANVNGNDGTNTNNHYWNQTTGGTLAISSNPGTQYYLQISTSSGGYGNGTTTKRGAEIYYRYGVDGTFYSDANVSTLTATCLWPFPMQEIFGPWAARADEAGFATAMPANTEARGFAASGQTLTKYLWEMFGVSMPSFPGAQAGGGAQTPAPMPTSWPVEFRGNFKVNGNMNVKFQ